MINLINAIIFGAVQGIGEFLPISSSGHLLLLHQFLAIPNVDEVSFDVFLHAGTLIAVCLYFWKDIFSLGKAFFVSFNGTRTIESGLVWKLIIATIPGAIFGFLLENKVESIFRSPILVAVMLASVGVIFILVEKISLKTDDFDKMTWKTAGIIGLSQAIALIPGTSRSGITIITGLALKLKREAAVRFSFLLSIPIIFGAVITKVPDIFDAKLSTNDYQILIVAFVSSAVFGILSIKFFVNFTKKYSLSAFAYYRFILALVIILASL